MHFHSQKSIWKCRLRNGGYLGGGGGGGGGGGKLRRVPRLGEEFLIIYILKSHDLSCYILITRSIGAAYMYVSQTWWILWEHQRNENKLHCKSTQSIQIYISIFQEQKRLKSLVKENDPLLCHYLAPTIITAQLFSDIIAFTNSLIPIILGSMCDYVRPMQVNAGDLLMASTGLQLGMMDDIFFTWLC